MHARRRQRDRDGYYEERQSSYSSSYPSSTYAEGSDRQKQTQTSQQTQQQQPASQPALPVASAADYGAEVHYSPPRSPNGGMSSSHGHAHSHSYSHGHSYNYGQSQSYSSQSYNHNRPYSRGSHGHHRRRYNYSPEVNNTYASTDNYQHNISEPERDRDYKSTRDKYTDRATAEVKEDGERERPTHERSERGTETRKHSSKSGKRIWNPSGTNGDWSEHISSSGKKYYYNCVSEVSQWEKPREWHEKRNKYNYSSRTGHERRESRSERESERSERSERTSHKRTSNTSHSSTYWRNNRQEYDEQRNRTNLPVLLEEPPQQPFPPASEPRNRNTPLPIPEVNYNRNEYDPRTFQHVAALPRIISHSASNGSSMTPPPPPAEIQQFTGPPTPTHSENHVDHPVIVELPISRRYEFGMYANLGSAPGPALTPSLSNYMRDDLVDHVTGWPADVLERQAQRYCDEANSIAKQVTRVSSELKCARSIVREREIQATLQEQKIMYLRQQIIELEESMSQNSIMCDDLCQ